MANGFFREDQSHRLGALLDEAAKQGLFRIVMIHHPPVRGAVAQHKRLFGIGNFQKTISRHGAELILHGHSHDPTLYWIGGKASRPVPVVGVAAGGQAIGGSHPAAQWNLLEISGEPEAWAVRLITPRPLRPDHAGRRIVEDGSDEPDAAAEVAASQSS